LDASTSAVRQVLGGLIRRGKVVPNPKLRMNTGHPNSGIEEIKIRRINCHRMKQQAGFAAGPKMPISRDALMRTGTAAIFGRAIC